MCNANIILFSQAALQVDPAAVTSSTICFKPALVTIWETGLGLALAMTIWVPGLSSAGIRSDPAVIPEE